MAICQPVKQKDVMRTVETTTKHQNTTNDGIDAADMTAAAPCAGGGVRTSEQRVTGRATITEEKTRDEKETMPAMVPFGLVRPTPKMLSGG